MITQQQMLAAGYAGSPNNIHSLPGQGWYGMPGRPMPKWEDDLRLVDGQLQMWRTKYYPRPGSSFMFCISGITHTFDTLAEAMDYMRINGRIAEPGLPAFYNSWD